MTWLEEAKKYLDPKEIDVVVYHKGCQDGMSAALCAWRKLGDGTNVFPIEYIPMHYKDPIIESEYRLKNVLLVDFSWSPEVLSRIRKIAHKVLILDHHKSSMESLAGIEGTFFEMEESGATMAWKYFAESEEECKNVPRFITYVKDRDIWKWDHRNYSEPMYYGIKDIHKHWNSTFRDYAKYLKPDNLEDLIFHGRQVMEKQKKWLESDAKDAKQILVTLPDGKVYNIMILERKTAGLCSEMAEYLYNNNDVHFTLLWFRHRENTIPKIFESWTDYRPVSWVWSDQRFILSFRTNREGVDVSKIAGLFGGGGHAKAAGAQLCQRPDLIFS